MRARENGVKAFSQQGEKSVSAPVVTLDETTSALDNKAIAVVQKTINNLIQDKILFIIHIDYLQLEMLIKLLLLTKSNLL